MSTNDDTVTETTIKDNTKSTSTRLKTDKEKIEDLRQILEEFKWG
jgi:hypothetical protein